MYQDLIMNGFTYRYNLYDQKRKINIAPSVQNKDGIYSKDEQFFALLHKKEISDF